MSEHAVIGMSSLRDTDICPGRVCISEGMPQRTSAAAEEGTKAHGIAEAILNGENPPCEDDMRDHVMVYVRYVNSLLAEDHGCILHVERKVRVTDHMWGTMDASVWNPVKRKLTCADLKYGIRHIVEIEGNQQLQGYGVATLDTLGYPAESIVTTIVQPRAEHRDGPIRSKAYDVIDMVDFRLHMLGVERRVKDAFRYQDEEGYPKEKWVETFLHPEQDACRFCLGAPKCPSLRSKAQSAAKMAFAPGLAYSPADLSTALDLAPIVVAWAKNVQEFAESEAVAGRAVPHYKLVDKKPSRKWLGDIDAAALAKLVGAKVADLFKPQELIAVGEVIKLCPGKNAAERAAVLDPFTSRESSGTALVHESDKRPTVNRDAKAVFAATTPSTTQA